MSALPCNLTPEQVQLLAALFVGGATVALPTPSPSRLSRLTSRGLSVRRAARDLGLSHVTLSAFLRTATPPHKRPNLGQEIDDYLTEHESRSTLHDTEEPMLTQLSLTDDILTHFGLTSDPFYGSITGPDDLFDLKEQKKAKAMIRKAIESQGLVTVVGEIGSGKTTILRQLLDAYASRRDVRLVTPQLFNKSRLTEASLAIAILDDLGVVTRSKNVEMLARRIADTIRHLYAEGVKVAIVIDEAHELSDDALRLLKRIYDVKVNHRNAFGIVVIGQPHLARRLRGTLTLSEFAQRTELFELESLNGSSKHYLAHKLSRAGLPDGSELFTAPALKLMADRATTPLKLENLAAHCLATAWEVGASQVTPDVVKAVVGSR